MQDVLDERSGLSDSLALIGAVIMVSALLSGLVERTGLDKRLGLDHVVETRRQALDLVIWRQVAARMASD